MLWLGLFSLAGYGLVRWINSPEEKSEPQQTAATEQRPAPVPRPTSPEPSAPPDTPDTPDMKVILDDPMRPKEPLIEPKDVSGSWPAEWTRQEEETLRLVNARRREGAVCGGTKMAPVPPLTLNEKLRSAARQHSLDMRKNNFMSHESSDGRDLRARLDAEGYRYRNAGENIARSDDPELTMDRWMKSPGHCKNIMNPEATEIGVGFVAPNSWTQNFGRPR